MTVRHLLPAEVPSREIAEAARSNLASAMLARECIAIAQHAPVVELDALRTLRAVERRALANFDAYVAELRRRGDWTG